MTATPDVKGWCPGAYKPMMSGDGLIVRVRPFFARLTAAQVSGLCTLAQRYGNGFLDLTNRANLQIRGVGEGVLDALLQDLDDLNLLDETPALESRRNILVTPFWSAGDETEALVARLLNSLAQLPDLPAKFGFSVDTVAAPLLTTASADIRIERSAGGIIVRADGADLGRLVPMDAVVTAVHDFATWFAAHKRPEDRRMASVLAHTQPPKAWRQTPPLAAASPPIPGAHQQGALFGAAFGQIDAAALSKLILETGAIALRVTPWRLFLLEGADMVHHDAFVTTPDDPLLQVDACPGAPFCTSATVDTRSLARALAGAQTGSLHVSGCAKGCARRDAADTTIVGRDGRFDLVRRGHAWDAPEKSGLLPQDLLKELTGSS